MTEFKGFDIRYLPYNLAPAGRGGPWLWLLPNDAKSLLEAGEVFMPDPSTDEWKAHQRE